MSFDAVLESTAENVTGKSPLLRILESSELDPGRRLRVLDAGSADSDDAAQPVIITLVMFSEIYAVA